MTACSTAAKAATLLALLVAASGTQAAANLALGKATTASSYYDGGSEVFPVANIVDGVTIDSGAPYNWSFWLSQQGSTAGEWVQVDLGASYAIGSVDLYDSHNRWYNDRGTQGFTLAVSNDGSNFSTFATDAFSNTQWLQQTALTVTPAGPVSGRYVRFTVDSCFGCQSAGLAEMAVFGSPVPEPTSVALMALGLAGLAVAARRRA